MTFLKILFRMALQDISPIDKFISLPWQSFLTHTFSSISPLYESAMYCSLVIFTQKKVLLYTRQKRNALLRFSPYEDDNCHEILISDQILLKLECDLDEYLYFPCLGTKHIKANGTLVFGSVNSTLLSAWNSKYVLHLQSMKTICCCYVRHPMCLLMFFCNSKIHFHTLGPLN